jgi:molybdopterin converting factor small subunit
MAQIKIPTPLRKFTNNEKTLITNAKTVGEAMNNIAGVYPELGKQMIDENGKIKRFIRIYLGDEDIKTLNDEATAVNNESVVSIIPAIAGGISF